jgi:hypothetical protein
MLDVNRLREAGAAFERPRLEPELSELRRRFTPDYDRACAVQAGEISPYGPLSGRRSGNGRDLATEPFCGDCHAVRAVTGPCRACGSAAPPRLDRMNPRARGMIE